jgi:ribosomal protein S18 acetylase RimI-like enzyme
LFEAQIEEAAHVLAQALAHDPLFVYALPNDAERAARLRAFLARTVSYGLLYGQVFTTSGIVMGAAVWLPPGSDVTPERIASTGYDQRRAIIGREGLLKIGQVLDYLNDVHRRNFAPDHWYLNVVGIAPAKQRQGIGHALVGGAIEVQVAGPYLFVILGGSGGRRHSQFGGQPAAAAFVNGQRFFATAVQGQGDHQLGAKRAYSSLISPEERDGQA